MTAGDAAGLRALGWTLAALPAALAVGAYVLYPAVLKLLVLIRPGYEVPEEEPPRWPSISLVVPAYNEAGVIREKLEGLLALDYPSFQRQILVVSDASTDGTDDIVREYADRGVELIRLPERGGKTVAENAARRHVTGDIVVNTDATIRILPDALKRLVRVFRDPTVGVASGRDVSVAPGEEDSANPGEMGYVDYEMWVRSLETRLGGIVGASGCFFAIRRELFQTLVPAALSRDFASAMLAEDAGYRAVSVDDACCLVPRTRSLRGEFRRKVRTMARGLDTLWAFRHLLNPVRHGRFAVMLLGHKLARWLVSLSLPLAVVGLLLLAGSGTVGWLPVGAILLAVGALVAVGVRWSERDNAPPALTAVAYLVLSGAAGVLSWWKAFQGEKKPTWEPTRRR